MVLSEKNLSRNIFSFKYRPVFGAWTRSCSIHPAQLQELARSLDFNRFDYQYLFRANYNVKKEGKDQESIQSSTTPDQGYQWESDNFSTNNDADE